MRVMAGEQIHIGEAVVIRDGVAFRARVETGGIQIRLPVPPSLNNMFPSKRGKRVAAVPAGPATISRDAYRAAVAGAKEKMGGRVKSKEYENWIRLADAAYMQQRVTVPGLAPRLRVAAGSTFSVDIWMPKIRGDIDNRIKAILDFLVRVGLTLDDRHARRVCIEEDLSLDRECVVIVAQRKANV
jgi:Holliday junction resolvase RusA-like endonuclease